MTINKMARKTKISEFSHIVCNVLHTYKEKNKKIVLSLF